MKPARLLSTLLMAWMLCFQAIAGVADLSCRHAPSQVTSAMAHHGHIMHAAVADEKGVVADSGVSSICSCISGCACASHCAGSCAGLAGGGAADFTKREVLASLRSERLNLSAAHALDLFRPPSIS